MSQLQKTIQAVEQTLQTTPVFLQNTPMAAASLTERMIHHNVPGVSIAVINKSETEWVKGYGIAHAESGASVTTDTCFSAASISKPVTALAILRLVQQGLLDLDTDVNHYLQQWSVPENECTQSAKVTLRNILSHTAGLDAGFYQGYELDEPVPTVIQLLNGEQPSNSDPVQVTTVPGTRYAYSGPGYWVLQQLITELAGDSFANAMQKLVLGPLGMEQSTFGHPTGLLSSGHNAEGVAIFDKSTRHPGLADGGLWTTPTDLARFAIAIMQAYQGMAEPFLQQSLAKEMLTPHLGFNGLGPFMMGQGDGLLFKHGGSGEGFHCQMDAFPERGQGAVIMVNGANGYSLIQETLRSTAMHYEWPHYQPIGKTPITLNSAQLSSYAGIYILEADPLTIDRFVEYTGQWQVRDGRPLHYKVSVQGDQLIGRFPNGYDAVFYPESSNSFFALDNSTSLQFRTSDDGLEKTVRVIESDELYLDGYLQ